MRAATLLSILPLAAAAPSVRSAPAPVIVPRGGNGIEGKYIIRMKPNSISTAIESSISAIQAEADYTYSRSFRGFAASLSPEELEKLQMDPNVSYPPPRRPLLGRLKPRRADD